MSPTHLRTVALPKETMPQLEKLVAILRAERPEVRVTLGAACAVAVREAVARRTRKPRTIPNTDSHQAT